MDWIKIKTKHMLFSDLTMTERGMLISIQSLTAFLEKEPSESEIMKIKGMGRKAFAALSDKLRNIDEPLSLIVRKVIEDVSKASRSKDGDAERKRVSRSNNANVLPDTHRTSAGNPALDKRREEKRREENTYSPFFPILNSWNNLAITVPVIPKLKVVDKSRENALRECANEDPEFFINFEMALEKIRASEFLRGNNDQRWTATFDWVLKNYLKILEGNYDQKEPLPDRSKLSKREIAEHEMIKKMKEEESNETV